MTGTVFQQQLERYADLIVNVGLNLQPGQRLLLRPAITQMGTPLETVGLVRAVTKAAYLAGARYVDVVWHDEELSRLRFQYAPRDSFSEYATWRAEVAVAYGQRGDALLFIASQDPDLFAGVDPALVATAQQAALAHAGAYFELVERNVMNWLIVSAPTPGWTRKVMAHLPDAEREAKLWEAIFQICRVNAPDPAAAWAEHVRSLTARAALLTARQYQALRYAAPGTDLQVGLPEGHVWRGGSLTNQRGVNFVPNMPTEEVFTVPHRDKVDGVVRSTKPLNFGGSLIEDFTLTFEKGRVVKAEARSGDHALQAMLNTDDGARHLGEAALVPHSSPVSQSGLLFYNTLYDENASCHLALGNGFKFCFVGGETMSDAAYLESGGNKSNIHVDFMIGSGAMAIDGVYADGRAEPLLRGGEWAFEV